MGGTVHCIPDHDTGTCQYVVHDEKAAIIVDPVLKYNADAGQTDTTYADQMAAYLQEKGLQLHLILETHVHADHISGSQALLKRFPEAKLAIGVGVRTVQETFQPIFNLKHLKTDGSQFDVLLEEGQRMQVGSLSFEVLSTPGHTADSSSYVFDGIGVFCGDTLFAPDKGSARCDFPNGSAATLYASIQKLLDRPDDTIIYLCHDYPGDKRPFRWATTVGEQRRENIHLRPDKDFVTVRRERDETLKIPHLLLPSVQLNLDAGKFPPPEDNGVSYVKIPINKFDAYSRPI